MVAQVGGREAGLPVVGVHEVGDELVDDAAGDVGRGAAERAEAAPVVGVVEAVRAEVGAAGAVVELRRVEHEEREAVGLGGDQPRRRAEQRR